VATINSYCQASEELRTSVAKPFDRAHAMPRSVYTSEDFLQQELEHIFSKDWICAGRASTLANAGDYLTLELAGQPIMVVREKSGAISAQSNVCLHRMSTLLEGRGNVSAIVCPYHAWTYELNGRLRGAPEMQQNAEFCKKTLQLPAVRCEVWLGWIMVTLNSAAPPVSEQLNDVESLVSDYAMQDYEETFFETHQWNTNWKVLAENFMESYHLPVCHRGTIGGLSRLDEMTCPEGLPAFNYHTILKDDSLKSLLITLTPGYFWYLSLHPEGVGQVRILFGGGMSPEYVNDAEAQTHFNELKSLLDEVNVEDRGCTEKVYRGLRSSLAEPGPLSHLERPNYDFAHYLANRVGVGAVQHESTV